MSFDGGYVSSTPEQTRLQSHDDPTQDISISQDCAFECKETPPSFLMQILTIASLLALRVVAVAE